MDNQQTTIKELDVELPKNWLQALRFAEMIHHRLDIPANELVILITDLALAGNNAAYALPRSQETR